MKKNGPKVKERNKISKLITYLINRKKNVLHSIRQNKYEI